MTEASEIKNRLRELADSALRRAGADLEERLLCAFRIHHRRRKSRRTYIAQAAGLMIVGVAVYFAFGLQPVPRARGPESIQSRRINISQNGESEILAGFVALPYAQSGVPMGEAVVMRVQLAPSDFKVLGVSAPPGVKRQQIGADLLIGQDGLARAVRFLP